MAKSKSKDHDEDELDELEDEDDDYDGEENDNDEGNANEGEESDEEDKPDPKGKRKKLRRADDEDEDEDDGGRKRRKASMFFEEEADVDDEEDEDEIDEDAEDLIDDADVDVPDAADYRAPMRRMAEERREGDEEEMLEYINQRYQRSDFAGSVEDGGAVVQQGLLPTINDPKLWIVYCRPGKEREACVQLLQKYHDCLTGKSALQIKSAICLDHLKGYIYVEAAKESHVRDAIRGLRTMWGSKGVKLVPLNEMAEAITVNTKAKAPIAPDCWVRVRGGLYKDDLAKVLEADYSSGRAKIKIIPRLDLAAMRDPNKQQRLPFGRQPTVRPSAKPFRVNEARDLQFQVIKLGDGIVQVNSHKLKDGYLLKDISLKNLILQESMPPIEEVSRFNNASQGKEDMAGEDDELAALMKALPADSITKPTFVKGDKVTIVRGELQNVKGEVVDIGDDGKIYLKPHIDDFSEIIDFEPTDLKKFFAEGDHVAVLGGPHAGQTGLVLKVIVEHDVCILLSDTTKAEIKCFARDLSESPDINHSVAMLGNYSLHDLIQLDNHTAGVIIQVDRDAARVLTNNSTPGSNDIRVVGVTDIQRAINARNSATTDVFGTEVRQNDLVTIHEGTWRGKTGTVEYVWRGYLFLKSPELVDQGGFMCTRARSVRARGSVNRTSKMAQAERSPSVTPSSPGHMSYPSPGRAGPSPRVFGDNPTPDWAKPPPPRSIRAAAGGSAPGTFSGRVAPARPGRSMMGNMVKVKRGQYTGYKGRVKNETDTHVQLELDALNRVVTVPKNMLDFDSEGKPMASPMTRPSPVGLTPALSSRTPLHPSMTPMHPSTTPFHPSMTPNHFHAPFTPAHTPSDDNWTKSWRDGGMPASAPTPYAQAYTPAFTPASTPGGLTPMETAPTPGLPPTPGMAPTPAIAPTPYLPANTPAFTPQDFAPTPGGYEAAYTPAVASTPDLSHHEPAAWTIMDRIWTNVLVRAPGCSYGVVKSVNADEVATIQPLADDGSANGETLETQMSNVTAVPPSVRKDKARVIKTDIRDPESRDVFGETASVFTIENGEAMVKFTNGPVKGFKTLKLYNLGKVMA